MKKIKKRSKYRSTIRLDLTLYASVSFIFVVVYEIWLIHIPAIFPSADSIGKIFNMLLSGYLLAYLIYLVDHHAEEMRAFRKIYPIVGQHIVDIINTGKGIIHNMANVQNINEIADYPDKKTVFQIFDNLKLGDRTAPMVDSKNLKNLTWIEYISYVNLYNRQNIMAIFFFEKYIDAELMAILSKIRGCFFMSIFDNPIIDRMKNDGGNFAFMYEEFLDLIHQLDNYYKKHIALFSKI